MKSKLLLAVVFVMSLFVFGIKQDDSIYLYHSIHPDIILKMLAEQTQAGVVAERVMHPNQLDIENIHAGDILIRVSRNSQQKILILKSPYLEDGDCKFDVIPWNDGAPASMFIENSFCNDFGLIEYSGKFGKWNTFNHIIRSEEPSLTPEQLEGVISILKQEPPQLQLHLENA